MKIEILEKVGEMTVTCLRSAEENNAIASAEAARKAEMARIAKEREEQEAIVNTAKLLATLIEQINAEADKGAFRVDFYWTEDKPTSNNVKWLEWNKYSDKLIPTLEQMGYECDTHQYSQAWRTRSGRIGYASIKW